MSLAEIPALPDYAACARAQSARGEFADAIQARDLARDTFAGFASNESHQHVLEAEDEVFYARARLEEWL